MGSNSINTAIVNRYDDYLHK